MLTAQPNTHMNLQLVFEEYLVGEALTLKEWMLQGTQRRDSISRVIEQHALNDVQEF